MASGRGNVRHKDYQPSYVPVNLRPLEIERPIKQHLKGRPLCYRWVTQKKRKGQGRIIIVSRPPGGETQGGCHHNTSAQQNDRESPRTTAGREPEKRLVCDLTSAAGKSVELVDRTGPGDRLQKQEWEIPQQNGGCN